MVLRRLDLLSLVKECSVSGMVRFLGGYRVFILLIGIYWGYLVRENLECVVI